MTTQQITLPREVVEAALLWSPDQAYAEGRSAYECSVLPNTTSAVRFNELSSLEQAFWVANAALRAALQAQPTPQVGQAAAEPHVFNDESPFCVKCGSTGEDATQPVAHILPRNLKILKFKSMPVPVDPLPYDNGEEKTVPLYTTPPPTPDAQGLQPVGQAAAEPVPPFGSIRKTAMAVYKPPFKYLYGYIYDSENHMVADNGSINDAEPSVSNAIALRIRGWGRIGYMPDAAKLQDEVGAMVADALTAYYTTPQPTPDAEAMRLALEALKTAQEALPPYGAIRRELDAAIAKLEALGVK